MFNKILFDRNPFDRSVDNDTIGINLNGEGELSSNIVVITPLSISEFKGSGNLDPGIVSQVNVASKFSGVGNLLNAAIILRLEIPISLSGVGDLKLNTSVKTPFYADLTGIGDCSINDRMFFYLHVRAQITSSGNLDSGLVMQQRLEIEQQGSGELLDKGIHLWLPLPLVINGVGEFRLRRLGSLNENVLELENIYFRPGDTITIDTDLFQVLFEDVEDVSAVTTESVFFEMNPGENEITIDIDSNSKLNITAIWQNRWL